MPNEIRFYRAIGEYGYMSSLFKRDIRFEGRSFRSAEDAYQYGKPVDPAIAEWLIAAPKPHLCAAAAHALFVFDIKPIWNSIKVQRMKDVHKAKYLQHADLREKLLSTGNAVLIEESKTDALWGIGKKGNGKNMFGKILMEIREEFKAALPDGE